MFNQLINAITHKCYFSCFIRKVPKCPSCGGVLKPEITFFGDNVPKTTVHSVLDSMFKSDAVLVIGSSLEVLYLLFENSY